MHLVFRSCGGHDDSACRTNRIFSFSRLRLERSRYGAERAVEGPQPSTQSTSFLSKAEAFGSGLYDDAVKPLVDTIRHPIHALEGIGHAIAHPIDTAGALAHAVKDGGGKALSGDPYAIGMALGTVGSLVVPGAGEAEAAEDAVRVGQVGRLAEASEVADVVKADEVADGVKVAEASGGSAVAGNAAAPFDRPSYAQNGDWSRPRDWKYQPIQSGRLEPGAVSESPELTAVMAESEERVAPSAPAGWPQLDNETAATFGTDPEPVELKPGTKLYRVIGKDASSAGTFWSIDPPPTSEAAWRAQSAVKDSWNGDGGYVETTIGPSGLKAWSVRLLLKR